VDFDPGGGNQTKLSLHTSLDRVSLKTHRTGELGKEWLIYYLFIVTHQGLRWRRLHTTPVRIRRRFFQVVFLLPFQPLASTIAMEF
jgi:hypothetical protein